MAHVKVLSPTELPLSDFLGPLPKGFSLEQQYILSSEANDSLVWARGQLRRELEESIRLAKPSNLTLVLPPGLIDTIADNVALLAKDEPCGLRGSSLKVTLVEDYPQQETVLLRLKSDSSTPTTHTLEVVLRPDPVSWYTKMAYIFRSFTKRRVVISPKYELRKNSLYNF